MRLKTWTQAGKIALILFLGLLINISTFAEETAETSSKEPQKEPAFENGFLYHPKGCDFAAEFPAVPFKGRRCDPNRTDQCYDITSYTEVFDMTTTVNVNIACNASNETAFDQYSEEVMRTSLRGIARKSDLDNYDIGFQHTDDSHVATLSGTGQTGRQDQIFVAQLWVGKNSILTVEAQLIGPSLPDADTTFSSILGTISEATSAE